MKHTKGNWNINNYENGAKSIKTEDDNEKEIACLHYGGMMLDKEELTANAKLIAAAPDLLAALKQTIECLDPSAIVMGAHKEMVRRDALNTIKKATE